MVGTVQGGVQSLSRSYFMRTDSARALRRVFRLLQHARQVRRGAGPAGRWASWRSRPGNQRLSILVLILFFVIGGWLLSRVRPVELPVERAARSRTVA